MSEDIVWMKVLSPIHQKEDRKEDPCFHGPLRRSLPLSKDHRYKAISLLGHLAWKGSASLGCSLLLASQAGASTLSPSLSVCLSNASFKTSSIDK